MHTLLSLFRILPLSTTHRLGACLGKLVYACSRRVRRRLRRNLAISQLATHPAEFETLKKANIRELGKSMLETFAIWQKDDATLQNLVKQVHGWEVVEAALAKKQGILFLTPHLGCFEITSIFYGARHPITVLYRPPKLDIFHNMIKRGRGRKGVTLAEANASGVRKLMQALKRGEAVGILPDQVPKTGEGEWVTFFGEPAYTMSLASKLANKTQASVIMAFGERLANGEGFDIHLSAVESIATPALLNQAIEQQIAKKPEQYLWSYNRFKQREHALSKPGAPKPPNA